MYRAVILIRAHGQLSYYPVQQSAYDARVTAEDDESFTFESAVRGHHVFKRIWTPVNGQLLQVTEVRAETVDERDALSSHRSTCDPSLMPRI